MPLRQVRTDDSLRHRLSRNRSQTTLYGLIIHQVALPTEPPCGRRIALRTHSGGSVSTRQNYFGSPRASNYLVGLLLFLFAAVAPPGFAQGPPVDLTQLNIEDLMKVEVTSVSKRQQPLSETAAAVFVISQEDISRSGATNVPDLLRMVPGLYVAQINANTWAITIRGFNGRFSRTVLVLVDGRTVYTPTFGGVLWDVLDIPLNEIDKIEVVRGPGGSVWGANAVNGVINILTKKAVDTKGTLVDAGGGNQHQGLGTVEHGGEASRAVDYRAFLEY